MPKFHVRCGFLKMTILADDPQGAAVELLQSRGEESWGTEDASHPRRRLGEQIVVEQPGAGRQPERFITFDLAAHLNRRTPAAAWRQVLASFDPNNN